MLRSLGSPRSTEVSCQRGGGFGAGLRRLGGHGSRMPSSRKGFRKALREMTDCLVHKLPGGRSSASAAAAAAPAPSTAKALGEEQEGEEAGQSDRRMTARG